MSDLIKRSNTLQLQQETAIVVTKVLFDLVQCAIIPEQRRGLRDRITGIVLAGLQAYQQQRQKEQLKELPSRN